MKRPFFLLIALSLFSVFLMCSTNSEAQVMTDYCQVPPYVTQNVPPNVMIVMDNSGSMMNFAFTDTADNNDCSNSGSPCTDFISAATPTYPAHKYYGYFDPDYWYTYGTTGSSDSTSRFYTSSTAAKTGSGLAGARAKTAAEWDGNFLNWLAMRRVDILKRVLTGGKSETGETGSYLRLVGENSDATSRGVYKQVNVTGLVDNTYSGTRCFIFDTGGNPSNFSIRTGSSCGNSSDASFDVKVRVKNFSSAPLQGVLQDISTKVRLGLTFYDNTDYDGGVVMVPMGNTNLSNIVSTINGKRPDSNTPLAETLWTVVGDFAQQTSLLSGPGPRYHSGDFTIDSGTTGTVNDPFNYGTKATPRYPSCSKSFVLFITDGEPCADGNLPATLSNYSGVSPHISPFTCSGGTCPATSGTGYSFPASTFESCGAGGYTAGFEDVALYMHTNDLRSGITGTQSLTLYPVFVFGSGSTLLKYAAINGGFIDSNGNNIPDLPSEWDSNGDGQPDTYYEATEGADIEQSLKSAFSNMISRVSSGTAAAVLASGEGSGANLVQASFYPRRRIGNDMISWTGGLQNLWYYLNPTMQTNIREDTVQDRKLNLQNDDIMTFYFDINSQSTLVARFTDTSGTGTPLSAATPTIIPFESVKNIWDAGKLLWSRNLSTDPRTIYTSLTGSTLYPFTTANASTLASYLTVTDLNGSGSNVDEAQNVISYLTGTEIIMDLDGDGINDYRMRTVQIGSGTNVWKLGDILNSTPKIATWIPLNPYWSFSNPITGKCVYCDSTYNSFVTTAATYTTRGVVFAGANDGMMHAFKLGHLDTAWTSPAQGAFEKARLMNLETGNLCGTAGDPASKACGRELWSFIPKNALPYLKYISDPDYCHVYTVDLTPVLVDASINIPASCSETTNYWKCDKDTTSWSTILIGGMRQGGACRNIGTACNNDGLGTADCVNTPANGLGYSSYFALDVTDQNNPKVLWEFSDANIPLAADKGLGFATSGPAVVRISAVDPVSGNPVATKNGRWFVVLASGPTGSIDTSSAQFLGRSDQNLKLFVLDLKTGTPLRTIDTGIQYAYSGSLYHSTHDMNWMDAQGAYQDDTIYVPYTKRDSTTGPSYTWTQGGIGNLLTLDATGKENLDPAQWIWRPIIDNIGPVTASVQNLDDGDNGNSWLFFGTGRYYFTLYDDATQTFNMDDQNNQRRLFGIKHPCAVQQIGTTPATMKIDRTCSTTVNFGALTDVTNIANAPTAATANASAFKGWYINLDSAGTYTYAPDPGRNFGTERNVTDPSASVKGCVYYTTFKPYGDACALGGKSFFWVTAFNTGGINSICQEGNVMVQLSTGAIEQKDLKTSLTAAGGRKSSSMEGMPPGGPPAISNPPAPVKRILQIKER